MISKRYGTAEDGAIATASQARRAAALVYSAACYLAFLVTFVCLIAFVGNLVAARSIDADSRLNYPIPLVVDLALVALFGLQHSVMARAGFKRLSRRAVPIHLERSTYVLLSSVVLALLMWLWQPMPGLVWRVDGAANLMMRGAFWCGWVIVLLSTFAISHFDLFGLKQAYLHWRALEYRPPRFMTPLLYRIVRHPMMFGMIMALWAAPRMSVGHLLFAVTMTFYILIGIRFEERDLNANFGDVYRDYQSRTPMLVPLTAGRASAGQRRMVLEQNVPSEANPPAPVAPWSE